MPSSTSRQAGITCAIEVGDYSRHTDGVIGEFLFSAAPPEAKQGLQPFKIPTFLRTLGEWLNMLVDTGFRIERIGEPTPDDRTVKECPAVQDAQVVAYFLHIRARKAED
ncbi:MAG TPA: hypothetical protein PLO37_12920 [Candidatus Hydrogenedentes bacterium]|nr:hypothetical protein [Candidatus Hydrogenedentota bacterium]HPG67745.1 hypothetical protein [Candidatus Hydrogenedentota bacterium]